MRADHLLLQRCLAPSRSAAARLIGRGAVRWLSPTGWVVPRKAGDDLPEGCEVEVTDDAELRWVSRAGLKLEAALARTGLDASGAVCLDVGQSTGGFTQVLLARGAARVVGVDVGHGQLHPELRRDTRITALEGVNARHLTQAALGDAAPAEGFGFIVGDLSFISLTLVLPALRSLCNPQAQLLMLVKPQFELQPQDIGKGGLVKDPQAHEQVQARIRQACAALQLHVHDYFESAALGGDGNQEFFVWAMPAPDGDRP